MKKENTVLNKLIETLKDGQEGFKQAAESVRNPALKVLFSDYSHQRSRFATALQSEARHHGETEPETSSSSTGALHRGWINLKSAITGGDEHAVLAECERGEDSAVEEYKKAMDDGLSPSAQELVVRQFAEIKAAHDRIKSLRDAAKS
ncbi:MAG TPA: PA2169 family four-helix-bundle protein [Candidatus Udaeobacter sp.]|nr:PA2169 family four-helix-bundle protein [Candidatus Udaeobacter sp.]